MTNWKKLLLSGASLALAGSVLVACGSSQTSDSSQTADSAAASSDKIKLWVQTGGIESITPIVENFTKETGYEVEILDADHSKAQENVKKDPSAAADVFALPHDQLGQLVESGIIQELPETYAQEIAATQTDQAIAGAQYQGKTYAFPYGIESMVLLYNKSLLSEEDITTYENITSKATFGGTFKEANAYYTGPLFLSVGNTLFGENGEDPAGTNWGNEAGASVLKWIADQNNNPGFVNLDPSNVMSQFGEGKVAAIEAGPWDYQAAQEAVGAENLGVATYPKVTIGDKEVQQKAFLGVRLYAVNQAPAKGDAKRIAASYKLAALLTNKDTQAKQFVDRNVVPSNKEAQAAEAVQSDELAKAVIAMGSSNDYTVVMPKLSQMTTFWTESAAILSDAYNGKLKEADFQTRLEQFDKDIAATN